MTYSISELAQLMNVTPRSLRWYDEIDLLKPSHHTSLGRFYGDEEVSRLRMIVLFKSLGASLEEIKISFNQGVSGYRSLVVKRKKALLLEQGKIQELLELAEQLLSQKTFGEPHGSGPPTLILSLKETEQDISLKIVLESVKSNHEESFDKEKGNTLYEKIVKSMLAGALPEDDVVQELIGSHYQAAEKFHVLDKKTYLAFAEVYSGHQGFKSQLEWYHQNLPLFMSRAMIIFARENL